MFFFLEGGGGAAGVGRSLDRWLWVFQGPGWYAMLTYIHVNAVDVAFLPTLSPHFVTPF